MVRKSSSGLKNSDSDPSSANSFLLKLNDMDSSVVMENDKNESGGAGKTIEDELDLRLHDAVCDPENLEELQDLIQDEPHLIHVRDKEGNTPLHTLIKNVDDDECLEVGKILLGVTEARSGVPLKIERPDLLNLQECKANYTPLHLTSMNRQVKMLRGLLEWGADPTIPDKHGNTPLHILASEGRMKLAVECGMSLLNSDSKISLINTTNKEEKTPVHVAVDTESMELVQLLLSPQYEFDFLLKDKKGRNLLHYACSGTDETEESCEILKVIVHRFKPSNLNERDNLGRTALHWTTIQRLPRMTAILIAEDSTDVLSVDNQGKTPLHYASQNGRYPRGQECIEELISRRAPEGFDHVKYMYKNEDKNGFTPFMYTCLNSPSSTVKKYLTTLSHPKLWLTGTCMTLVYKESPLSIIPLMNNAICEDKERGSQESDHILVDYGPITGYVDPVENPTPQQETKYLKEGLNWDYETQKEVFLHPLVQLFIVKKWRQLISIIWLWVLWQLVWLGAYTTLILLFFRNNPCCETVSLIATLVMFVYILTSLVNECFELWKVKCSYFTSHNNLSQLARNGFALISIYPVWAGVDEVDPWLKYCGATGILLSYILSMRDVGKLHDKIGLVVEVLKQVLIQIVQVLLYCSPLWVGFTLAFVVIFDDEESLSSSFPGPLVKVLVMMTGEFEYKDTFVGEGEKKLMASYAAVRLLFFLAFLVSVPVAFFNLLTGFALDKVMELRERAKVGRMVEQLEHIYFIESILLTLRPIFKLILPDHALLTWFRKRNVTTVWFDQEWGFSTVQMERMSRGSADGGARLSSSKNKFPCQNFSFCERKLGRDVEERIYALASANSSDNHQKSTQFHIDEPKKK